MHLLNHDEILNLVATIRSARLLESRVALLAGIDAGLVGGIARAASSTEQILQDLETLNSAELLEDGSIPLAIWLANAVVLCGIRKEAAVFKAALAGCQHPKTRVVRSSPFTPGDTQGVDTERAATVKVRLFNVRAAEEWTILATSAMTVLQIVGVFKDTLRMSPWKNRGAPKPGFGYTINCYQSETDTDPLGHDVTVSELLQRGSGSPLSLNIEWYRSYRGQSMPRYR